MHSQPTAINSFAGLKTDDSLLQLMKSFPIGWVVYILECEDGSLYTGVSNDLAKRLKTHITGRGAKYTRSHIPTRLAYVEPRHSQSDALQREAEIKQFPREKKLKLIRALTAVASKF